MADINQTAQGFEPGDMVVLFEVDATSIGGSILRFTSTAWETQNIVFDGDTYVAVDVEADGFEWSGQGALPMPKLRISNANKVASAAVIQYGDLLGATVRRIRTFRQFLDNGSDPDPTATFPIDVFRVERKAAHNKVFIEWELAAAMDQQGRKLPGRQVLKDACTHRYRIPDGQGGFIYTNATCPYTGTSYFDENGVATTADMDKCGKRLSDCRLRFGQNGVLPTRAFPGVAQV